jgi:hypothetical protein
LDQQVRAVALLDCPKLLDTAQAMAVGPARIGRSAGQHILACPRESPPHFDRGGFALVLAKEVEDFADAGRVPADVRPIGGEYFVGSPSQQ